MAYDPIVMNARRAGLLLRRALRLRCPTCGAGGLRSNWVTFKPACPRCALRLDRGETDFFLGAYLVNLIIAELIAAGFIATMIVATWPDVPWTLITYCGALLVVVAPLVTYPFSRISWLAIDLIFQPAGEDDFAAAVDAAPTHS
jgi:uncharacterized protein (DUF983 family)